MFTEDESTRILTEAESIRKLKQDRSARKPTQTSSSKSPSQNDETQSSELLDQLRPTEILGSHQTMTVEEIAEAIGMSVRHIAEIPERAATRRETLTRPQLDDLVFFSVKLPFSIAGYELSSQIAAVVRRANMEEWWRTLRRYKYRGQVAIAHARRVANTASHMSEHDDWGMEEIDWDLMVFSYHYLLIKSLLPKRFEVEPTCFGKGRSDKVIEGRKEFLGSIDGRRTESEREIVSTALVKMLRNWRRYHQSHIWTRILEFKVLTNLVAVKWEKTPREERASSEMRDYLNSLEYVASLEHYSKEFPGEIAPLFNLLAIASRFGDTHLYEKRFLNLCNAGEEGNRFRDLDDLQSHPDADGDMDNFLDYWRRRDDH